MSKEKFPFARVLLVEDEFNLATTLRISLKTLGADEVALAPTLAEARGILTSRVEKNDRFDLVLLDRMLPDGDGLELCEELRASGFEGVILVLTANGLVEERIKGLDMGADDYLAKPFSWDELAARLRALGRRRGAEVVRPAIDNSVWKIDQKNLKVLGPKGWVDLTPLELKLFTMLYESEGNIVSRDELLKNVWGFKWLPKTRTVDFFMTRLRRAFEPVPETPRHFLTIRGIGYKFVA